jgi:glucose-1-phosphate adenylyltransferase
MPGMEEGRENTYWRDVGTIDAYYEASMDLRSVAPEFNLYNPNWPIRSSEHHLPPTKFVHDSPDRTGRAINSIVCHGSILSGCLVRGSIVGRGVRVHSYAEIEDCILMDGVEIGERARVRRAIIDKNTRIAPGDKVGYDLDRDRERFPDGVVSPGGILVIPRHRHPHLPVTELALVE